jgi:hypothetical protein
MEEFVCHCKWKYILGSKEFYGPIFTDGKPPFTDDATLAKLRPIRDFEDEYGDCWSDWKRTKSTKRRIRRAGRASG